MIDFSTNLVLNYVNFGEVSLWRCAVQILLWYSKEVRLLGKKTFEDSIKRGPNLPHDNELFRSKRNLTSNNRKEKETVEV